MATLGQVLSIIETRYGVMDKSLQDVFVELLLAEMNSICRTYDLWFMRKDPDPDFKSNFPITSGYSLSHGSYFMDQGWFYTADTIAKYQVYAPYYRGSPSSDSHYSEYWLRHNIKNVNFAYLFDSTGANTATLQFVPYSELLAAADFSSSATGEPRIISTYTDGPETYLILNPVPDDEYYVCVSYNLFRVPELLGPESSNEFMIYYPDVTYALAKMVAAKHYKNWDEYQMLQMELFGKDRDSRLGGLLKGVVKDTSRRQSDSVTRTFSSEALAKGTAGPSVHFSGGDGSYFLPRL